MMEHFLRVALTSLGPERIKEEIALRLKRGAAQLTEVFHSNQTGLKSEMLDSGLIKVKF